MTNAIKAVPPPASKALSRLPIFGPPTLLKGEDAAAYDDLFARVSGNLKPSDIFEEIWVREIVDLIWERFRWRGHLASFHDGAIPKTLARILKPLTQNDPQVHGTSLMAKLRAAGDTQNAGEKLANEWAAGDKTAIEIVQGKLVSAGMTMASVVAQASASELDKIERFNRLIASAEWRCNALLHEIERHRATIAQKRRNEVRKIEDAEFETVDANPVAPTCN
jgi:hypothetical protein